MEKLKITIAPEETVTASTGGCGRNWDNLCGARN